MNRPTLRHAVPVAFVMVALAGCHGDITAPSVDCGRPELRSAYESAYASAKQGAVTFRCDGDTCVAEGMRAVADETVSGDRAACVLAGTREGLRAGRELRHKKRHGHGGKPGRDCSDGELADCRDDGKFAGRTAAELYCRLSIDLGGLAPDAPFTPGPETTCGRKFENACTRVFDRTVAHFSEIFGNPDDDCTRFARDEFQEVYEVTRFNQCLFDLAEPEPEAPGEVSCEDVDQCNVTDQTVSVRCERVGACTVECVDCDVTCENVDACRVEMETGSVECSDVASCEVTCSGGEAPSSCGDGRIVCGQSCS